jgi:hypothetical protein
MATPAVDRRAVAADLRQDWPAAWRQAGFDTPGVMRCCRAMGIRPGPAPDRFLVTLVVLSLFCEVAEHPHWWGPSIGDWPPALSTG